MRILVVDDEVIVVRALTRAFQSKGHQVSWAHSGEDGLEKWIATTPDVIILDVVMPGLTGPQVIEEFSKRQEGKKAKTKIILMTAHSGIKGHSEALKLGADDFVQKPFEDVFGLVARVEELAGAAAEPVKDKPMNSKPVTIYPIQCQLTSAAGNVAVNIVKLASGGMLVDSMTVPLKVNSVYSASFTFTHNEMRLEIPVMVYKVYDEYAGHSKPGHHLNELVFKNPSVEARRTLAAILGFISAHSK